MANLSLDDLMKSKRLAEASEASAGVPSVPEPQENGNMVLTDEERKRVDSIKENLNLMDGQACLQFGTPAQRNISDFADSILNTVRSKDSGYVGELLQQLIADIKDADLSGTEDSGFLEKIPILGRVKNNLERLKARYEKLEVQIGQIEGKLDQAKMEMLKDIGMFDMMYEKNLEYFRELKEIGPDALIISDPGMFLVAKEACPGIDIHISTQANNVNYMTFRFWHAQGAARVVTGRELSLEEIRQLGAQASPEQISEIVEKRLHREINKGVQTIQYQVITLMTTNGQAPFLTVFMYLNEAKNEQEKKDLALIYSQKRAAAAAENKDPDGDLFGD